MKTMNLAATVLVVVLLASGCASTPRSQPMPAGPSSSTMFPSTLMMPAIVYTHTWQPLTLDMNRTKIGTKSGTGEIKHLQIAVVGVAWDSAAIGDIAQKQGLKEIYSADLEIFSILHIWNQYTVHVYGE